MIRSEKSVFYCICEEKNNKTYSRVQKITPDINYHQILYVFVWRQGLSSRKEHSMFLWLFVVVGEVSFFEGVNFKSKANLFFSGIGSIRIEIGKLNLLEDRIAISLMWLRKTNRNKYWEMMTMNIENNWN